MKRLEGEVLDALEDLGENPRLAMKGETVSPHQFHGLELNPRAVAIADLVLWIGYLKWQLRTVKADQIAEPILHAYGTIKEQDAILAWDKQELLRDENGVPLSRWDGETMRLHPITGEEIPDPDATVELYRYENPRPAEWPEAEFIVGNPPFIGGKDMRAELGDWLRRSGVEGPPEDSRRRRLRHALLGRGSGPLAAQADEGRGQSATPLRLHHHQLRDPDLLAPCDRTACEGETATVPGLRRARPPLAEGSGQGSGAHRHDRGHAW